MGSLAGCGGVGLADNLQVGRLLELTQRLTSFSQLYEPPSTLQVESFQHTDNAFAVPKTMMETSARTYVLQNQPANSWSSQLIVC